MSSSELKQIFMTQAHGLMTIPTVPTKAAPTGERFIVTNFETEIDLEHVHRYLLAAELCIGKTVLDVASGEGYGTAILASVGGVTGLDLDAAAVEAAQVRYGETGATYLQGHATTLPFETSAFDVVVSFETIEHVAEHDAVLDEMRRVLKPEGVLIISTPDRDPYNAQLAEPNPYHIKELCLTEFDALLRARFENVSYYGQRVVFGSLVSSALPDTSAPDLTILSRTLEGAVKSASEHDRAIYIIAVCGNGEVPTLRRSCYEGAFPPNALSSLIGGVAERDREIVALRKQLADAKAALAAARDREVAVLDLAPMLDRLEARVGALRAGSVSQITGGGAVQSVRDKKCSA